MVEASWRLARLRKENALRPVRCYLSVFRVYVLVERISFYIYFRLSM